eukprot:s344_g28.t1
MAVPLPGNVEVEKGPVHKFLHLSFAFFILVALASYTASLASMLVIQRDSAGADYRICAPSALAFTFESVFGKVFVPHADYMAGPRNFYAGNCEGMVLSQDLIDQLYAGQIRDKDCAEVASGRTLAEIAMGDLWVLVLPRSITDEEGRCHTDHRGNPRVDCHLVKAGDLVWSIPLSFPIRNKIAHPVSWAFIKSQTGGAMARHIEANQHAFPTSKCVAEDRTEEEGLNLGDLSGMIFISLFIAIFGLLIHAGTFVYRCLTPPADAPPSPEDAEALWAVPPPAARSADPEAPAVMAPEKLPQGGLEVVVEARAAFGGANVETDDTETKGEQNKDHDAGLFACTTQVFERLAALSKTHDYYTITDAIQEPFLWP